MQDQDSQDNLISEATLRYQQVEQTLNQGFFMLRFPQGLEQEFCADYAKRYQHHVRVASFLGMWMFIIFCIFEYWLVDTTLGQIWSIRFIVYLPLFLLVLLFSYTPYFARFGQLVLSLMALIVTANLLLVLINTPGLDADYYFSGFLLLEIFCFTLIRLRFWYALTCAIIMYIAIISVYSILTGKVYELLINQSFFLFSVSAMSLTANYFMELSSRKDFLQSQLIQLRNIWLENSNQQLHQISKTDPLTGIANRRFFNQHLKKEWQRSSRLSLPVSLLMLDVDFFKAYNDIYGHLAGDRCLVSIAKLLAKFAQRPGDLVARYGGEEFVIVLASTPEQGGRYIAEKIMQAIHQLNLPNKGSKISNRVTVSIGLVSQVPSDNKKSKINNFIHQADQALYEAKKAGRSQLKVSCEELFLRENEINQAAEVKPDQKETSSTVDQSPAR